MEQFHIVHIRNQERHVIIALDPETRTIRWVEPVEGREPYTTRQAAQRRRKQLEEQQIQGSLGGNS
jgi:hypothetical protein